MIKCMLSIWSKLFTLVYVSVNCTGLELLVLAFWSMVSLLTLKSSGGVPQKYPLIVKETANLTNPLNENQRASLGPLGIGHV